MLDFSTLKDGTTTIVDMAANLSPPDLRHLTNEMIDTMLNLIAGSTDADTIFVPDDPEAHDAAAASEDDVTLAWTLGHVIVHTTASSEEAAALATTLARGVPYRGGRSRSEIPWQSITTIGQCIDRLEESRRMRLASLDMWPDPPYLDNTYTIRSGAPAYVTAARPEINCIARFILGLRHDADHLGQIADIVSQAKAARTVTVMAP